MILCGGSGTRLWPASRASRPKQFVPLLGPQSLFQTTVRRMQALDGAHPPVIVAGEAHVAAVREQLDAIGAEGVIIAEPAGRDSAPAIAAAAAWIAARDPEGLAVVVASDHHIPDAEAFAAAVAMAGRAAVQGLIVTFGVRPTYPATAFGYIRPGQALADGGEVVRVHRFVEKPNAADAQTLVDAGALWNSGNFVFQAAHLLGELELHAPEVRRAAEAAIAAASGDAATVRLGPPFLDAPRISIDYALMEKTEHAAVAPVAFEWSDVGAWDAVLAATPRDEDGNALSGDAVAVDSRNCLIRADGGYLVVAAGLTNIGVIAEADTILVCDLAASQTVKQVVERLAGSGRRESAAGRDDGVAASLADLSERLEQWLFTAALPVWWTLGADHTGGGFYEKIGLDGRPVDGVRRTRVQARQIYAYAAAGRMGWTGPWRQAVEHGLDALLNRHRRADSLFLFSAQPDGAPVEERAMLYEQAFGLLAMASASTALPERTDLPEAAEELMVRLTSWARHGAGFRESKPDQPFQANAQMHLLEAALAWTEAGGGDIWSDTADEIAELALTRLIDPVSGGVREVFDADWAPAQGVDGRLMEPGHQFEWAWLLDRWARQRGREDVAPVVRRLYAAGKAGIDPTRGVAIDAMLDDMSVQRSSARLWPQTEWLRAAATFAHQAGEGDARRRLERDAIAGARGLKRYLDTAVAGLWRDTLQSDGRFIEEPAPASSFYHLIGAIQALRG